MTLNEFITTMHHVRGGLKSKQEIDAMTTIYTHGIPEFVTMTVEQKQMGVNKTADYTTRLNHDQQREMYAWLSVKGFKVNDKEIELYILNGFPDCVAKEKKKKKKYSFGGF